MSKLKFIKKKRSGRDASGQVVVRHQGGEHKRFMRVIDFTRGKTGISGKVISVEEELITINDDRIGKVGIPKNKILLIQEREEK